MKFSIDPVVLFQLIRSVNGIAYLSGGKITMTVDPNDRTLTVSAGSLSVVHASKTVPLKSVDMSETVQFHLETRSLFAWLGYKHVGDEAKFTLIGRNKLRGKLGRSQVTLTLIHPDTVHPIDLNFGEPLVTFSPDVWKGINSLTFMASKTNSAYGGVFIRWTPDGMYAMATDGYMVGMSHADDNFGEENDCYVPANSIEMVSKVLMSPVGITLYRGSHNRGGIVFAADGWIIQCSELAGKFPETQVYEWLVTSRPNNLFSLSTILLMDVLKALSAVDGDKKAVYSRVQFSLTNGELDISAADEGNDQNYVITCDDANFDTYFHVAHQSTVAVIKSVAAIGGGDEVVNMHTTADMNMVLMSFDNCIYGIAKMQIEGD